MISTRITCQRAIRLLENALRRYAMRNRFPGLPKLNRATDMLKTVKYLNEMGFEHVFVSDGGDLEIIMDGDEQYMEDAE